MIYRLCMLMLYDNTHKNEFKLDNIIFLEYINEDHYIYLEQNFRMIKSIIDNNNIAQQKKILENSNIFIEEYKNLNIKINLLN